MVYRSFRPVDVCVSLGLIAACLLCGPVRQAGAENPETRPNIIVILTDDQGYGDLSFRGSPDVRTPHLDALAAAGVECTEGYVTGPICTPSRAGLITGRYQQRAGFVDNRWSSAGGLSPAVPILAGPLAAAGYRTIAIGKWHLGQFPEYRPLKRGFTDHYGFLGGGRSYLPLADSQGVPWVPKDPEQVGLWRNDQRVADPPHVTDAFGDAAVDSIRQYRDQPFFIYLAFNAPHLPLQTTPEYLARFPEIENPRRRTYAAMLSAVDDAVGRLQQALDETGLNERTLIFFLSDNGGHPRANTASNHPLRGEKGTLYEGGIRVPFLVKWTGRLPAGKTYPHPVTSLDIAATAFALAGIEPDPKFPLDGVNLLPYLSGENSERPHETLYWRFVKQFAVRHGDWKLTSVDEKPPQLFDLSNDVSESEDLAQSHPEIVARLQSLYESWEAEMPPAEAQHRPSP